MDRQRCKIEIESYGYNTRDIDYRWERGDDSVTLNTKIELPQFKILGFKMGQEIQNLSSGDYIRLYCEIHFVRSMGYYLFQIYIPASLIVMISWVSFWLHRNATPARVALGVTTVLTMTTLMSSTNAALPKISYIKSIDVFLGTCFVMVFAALLEYASVGYIGKRIAMKRKRLQDLQQMQQHHQKVCVAAAASAAAAAAAANSAAHQQHQHQQQHDRADSKKSQSSAGGGSGGFGRSLTLKRQSGSMKLVNTGSGGGSKTIQRSSVGSSTMTDNNRNGDLGAQYGTAANANLHQDLHRTPDQLTATPRPNQAGGFNLNSPAALGVCGPGAHATNEARAPLLAAGAAIAAAAAANQHPHGATTEFEVNQTHDMIRICGLTPSSIDKHSRVVFPVCFVCFNLMYWIIYGHISQQIEDKGPPLIPFIKN
uniref:Gamma-aminobutyric acid receptor subunit beta n=1 Tax=Aceria tosichella TaxID=561515 RepID=A0A6G1S7R6_9ACAR